MIVMSWVVETNSPYEASRLIAISLKHFKRTIHRYSTRTYMMEQCGSGSFDLPSSEVVHSNFQL